jgi:hypothetical protein
VIDGASIPYVRQETARSATFVSLFSSSPAIVAETSLAYFREFLARESLRHHQGTDPTD